MMGLGRQAWPKSKPSIRSGIGGAQLSALRFRAELVTANGHIMAVGKQSRHRKTHSGYRDSATLPFNVP
jgi:hypothetical protein